MLVVVFVVVLSGRCSLPPETGPCRAAFRRWYFNSTVNECVEFVYGGCEGNENNFETKENCNTTCNVSAVPHQGWYIGHTVSFFVTAIVHRHVYARLNFSS